jgi:hypothetical protein
MKNFTNQKGDGKNKKKGAETKHRDKWKKQPEKQEKGMAETQSVGKNGFKKGKNDNSSYATGKSGNETTKNEKN